MSLGTKANILRESGATQKNEQRTETDFQLASISISHHRSVIFGDVHHRSSTILYAAGTRGTLGRVEDAGPNKRPVGRLAYMV